jgi:hypothetical protein
MSSTTIDTSTTTSTLQSLARTIMDEFDANQDGQFSFDEFANFLDGFVASVTGQKPATATTGTAAASSAASSATSLFLTSAGATTTAASATDFRGRMYGFDFSRMDSAKGTLKYDAANLMQAIDPSSAGAMQKVYDEMVKLHPGQVSLDKDGNLMLDGTADGYIGVRPENWANGGGSWTGQDVWQWFSYNAAHPGPNGETK